MKTRVVLCFAFLANFISFNQAADLSINFLNNSFSEAKKLAAQENKLIFLEFYANWCSPCKWMESNTFKDEDVVQAINNGYVPVRADIDKASGFELKNAYDIKYLPTILIFDASGQLLDRLEETLTARNLLEVLVKYNDPSSLKIRQHEFNLSPNGDSRSLLESESMKKRSQQYKEAFYEKQSEQIYRVQVGVFEDYISAVDMVKTLRTFFEDDVNVIHVYENNVPLFKIRIGKFSSIDAAKKFKTLLESEYHMYGEVI